MRILDFGVSSPFADLVASLIEHRAATGYFDPGHTLDDAEIARLADLATRAPSAFNLQNWRLHAVRTPSAKAALRAAAFGQAKVEEAAVTFVVSGEIARAADLPDRLHPAVVEGHMTVKTARSWVEIAGATYAVPEEARDEALRSASLLASTLMFAAEGHGLATAPMSGFDRAAVSELLRLPADIIPFFLVAVGRPRPGNHPQKPRRPVSDVLVLV